MNIYDAVRELLDNRSKDYLHPDDQQMLADALQITPTVVANMTGGVLQGASANMPLDVYVLDFDDTDPSPNVVEIEGSECYRQETGALVDPAFVDEVINAESDHA